jgi:hypothetical protein
MCTGELELRSARIQMSFDLYLVSFADQQPSGIPRSAVLAAFGDDVRWEDEYSGVTQYSPMDDCHIELAPLKSDPELISCVSINRPAADQRFLASLYKIMRLGGVALFFPGGKGPLIANSSAATQLPVFEHLGEPIVVQNGNEILKEISSPSDPE